VPASPTAHLTAGDVLTLDELRDLRRTSSLRGAGLVLHAWAVIAGAVALNAVWPSPLALVAGIAVIGSRQLGLMVLMHEASHWLLFSQHRLDVHVGQWLCAHPVLADLVRYRRGHHLHHRHTQQPDDPDLDAARAYPATRGRLALEALRDLSGWTAVSRVLAWRPPGEAAGWRGWRDAAVAAWRPVACNAAILAVLAAAGHWPLYLLLWLLPLATWCQLLVRLRAMAEHAMVPDDADPLRNARTVTAGPLARAFLAPYAVNFHVEHHLLVFVPCWKLARAHALLLAKGHGAAMERASSYAGVVSRAIA
jgi:fatty acid desaturase